MTFAKPKRRLHNSLIDFRWDVKVEQYLREHDGKLMRSAPVCFCLVLLNHTRSAWRRLVCKLHGHDIECFSNIGPESGVEHMICKRCGVGWTNLYY